MSWNFDDDPVYRPRTILRRTPDKRVEGLRAERRLEIVPPRTRPDPRDEHNTAGPAPDDTAPER